MIFEGEAGIQLQLRSQDIEGAVTEIKPENDILKVDKSKTIIAQNCCLISYIDNAGNQSYTVFPNYANPVYSFSINQKCEFEFFLYSPSMKEEFIIQISTDQTTKTIIIDLFKNNGKY